MNKYHNYRKRLIRRAHDMRQLYDEGREAGIPPEVLRAVATAYLNLATAAVDIKKAVDCAPEKPTLRVVK